MDERQRAEEHLRVIRTLMERATIYRAISAPTALAGGLIALGLTSAIWARERHWAQIAPQVMRHGILALRNPMHPPKTNRPASDI